MQSVFGDARLLAEQPGKVSVGELLGDSALRPRQHGMPPGGAHHVAAHDLEVRRTRLNEYDGSPALAQPTGLPPQPPTGRAAHPPADRAPPGTDQLVRRRRQWVETHHYVESGAGDTVEVRRRPRTTVDVHALADADRPVDARHGTGRSDRR